MVTNQEIEKLVQKAKKGDEKSFAKLFDVFYDKIFRYVRFRVDAPDTEDLVSEVFLKTVQNIQKYSKTHNAKFSSWIFRIAHNSVIDFYRKKRDFLGIDNDPETEDFFIQIKDESPTPDEHTQQTIEIKKMHEVLKLIPANHREILVLKFLEGFSNTEISKITGKSEGNIRILQLRALREMRKHFD
ncbi:MAG: RNA polymerase sigma factor [Candidatus Peregrinibacteria bacterium]|nr:RNA polymerase sigma factor [Candidatus Peregrinibacteria bacterium]